MNQCFTPHWPSVPGEVGEIRCCHSSENEKDEDGACPDWAAFMRSLVILTSTSVCSSGRSQTGTDGRLLMFSKPHQLVFMCKCNEV